jgi:Flp pilus assembly protein TadD
MHRAAACLHASRIPLSFALAGALLSGCTSLGTPFPRHSADKAEQTAEQRQQQAVIAAEAAVLAAPLDAALRAQLGTTYLSAGRFHSAATSFADAAALGDASAPTLLRLALALIGSGREVDAAALLFNRADELPAADLGLALALAGEVGPAIRYLESAIRDGERSVALRQNLALACALAGRWREARLMAAVDVPAGNVGERMERWAALALASSPPQRLAMVLRLPAHAVDGGLPTELVLAPVERQSAGQAVAARAPIAPAPPRRSDTNAPVTLALASAEAKTAEVNLAPAGVAAAAMIVAEPVTPIAMPATVAALAEQEPTRDAAPAVQPRVAAAWPDVERARTLPAYFRRQNRSAGARW